MYHEGIRCVIDEAASTSAFHRYATAAIDMTDAWKYGALPRATIKSSQNSLYNSKMKCFVRSAVT